jgi:hypothetical protein
MRCLSCNKILSDFESTRKSANTGEYLDLCNSCFSDIQYDVDAIVREDLREDEQVSEDDDYDDEEETW